MHNVFMTCLPHSRLLLGASRSVVVSGPHIQILDSNNGELVHSTDNLAEQEKGAMLKSGPVRCVTVDETFTHLVTTADDKKMKVWGIDGLKLLSVRELPKKPTAIAFTHDGQTILVSDKFGDVFSYPLHPKARSIEETEPRAGSSKRGALTSHENPSDGELVLGHVSLLTTFLLTPDEKFIITADRDEHIRVSWFPKGYVIERYCLGHLKFVSAIHIPSFAPEMLISGGGDPMLKAWNWMSGELVAEIPVLDTVKPYIQVKVPKSRRAWDDGDAEESGTAGNDTTRRKKRGRKGRGQGTGAEKEKEASVEGTPGAEGGTGLVSADAEGVVEEDVLMTSVLAEGSTHTNMRTDDAEKTVLVIHKIQSFDLGEHGKFVLFSAVGATALFYCRYPEAGAGLPPTVHEIDFGCPVVDFTLGLHRTTWVSLDTSTTITDGATETPAVVMLLWQSGAPVRVQTSDASALLISLRTTCVLPATPADLKTLDLYGPLASLPKNVDPERDPLRRDLLAEVALAEVSTPEPRAEDRGAQGSKKELSQREQARMKKKRALMAKLLEEEKRKAEAVEDAGEGAADAERVSKRVRPDSTSAAVGTASMDEAMDQS